MDSTAIAGKITGPIELLKKAWSGYRANFKTLTLIALIPALITFAAGFLFVGTLFVSLSAKTLVLGVIAVSIVAGLIQLLSQIALIIAVGDPTRTTSFSIAYKRAWGVFVPYIGLSILTMLVTGGGTLLFLIPGLFAAIAFSLSSFAYANEGLKGFAALRQSAHYVKGYWWAVFGRLVVLAIASGILLQIPVWIFGQNADITNIISALLSLMVIPFGILFVSTIYGDLKTIKGSAPAPTTTPAWMKAFLVLGIVAAVAIPLAINKFMPDIPLDELLKLSPSQMEEFGASLEGSLNSQNFEGMSPEQIEAELEKAFNEAIQNSQTQ